MRLAGSVAEKIHLNVEDETVLHKVWFLVKMPKQERSKTPWWKLFTSYLLMSPENQKKIREADEVAKHKGKTYLQFMIELICGPLHIIHIPVI